MEGGQNETEHRSEAVDNGSRSPWGGSECFGEIDRSIQPAVKAQFTLSNLNAGAEQLKQCSLPLPQGRSGEDREQSRGADSNGSRRLLSLQVGAQNSVFVLALDSRNNRRNQVD